MSRIDIVSAFSTGLDPAFAGIRSIDVMTPPIGRGAFGVAYRTASMNGQVVPAQVVKLLLDEFPGTARRGFETIQELQRRLSHHETKLRAGGSSVMERHPALAAVPQLSFEGHFEGRSVLGYVVQDLNALGMEDFANVLADDVKARRLQQLPFDIRMNMAAQLVDAFDFLSSHISYIHADIKAEALFVDLGRARCALIDYDSGAVARDSNDRPTTFGTKQDWLAPEIVEQLERPGNMTHTVKVDVLSDVWSVNMAIHYLLFGFSPLFFLTEISERSMRDYFRRFRWPEADSTLPYFRREYAPLHAAYLLHLQKAVPREIVNRLAFTINHGYTNPGARTSYGQWKSVLIAQNPPAIKSFTVDRTLVIDLRPVRLEWSVSGPGRVEIAGVGDVTGRTSIEVSVRRSTTFTLTLKSLGGPPLSRAVQVAVDQSPPTIGMFGSNVAQLAESAPARLAWRVKGAEHLTIDPGVGDVSGQTSTTVRPRRDTTYTLTATSPFGVTARASVTLRVPQTAPRVVQFSAGSPIAAGGDEVALSWNVLRADEIAVSPGPGRVAAPAGTVRVRLNRTTTFTLTATSYFGIRATANVTVTVLARTPLQSDALRSRLATKTALSATRTAVSPIKAAQ